MLAKQRIEVKMELVTYQLLHGFTTIFLSDQISVTAPTRSLKANTNKKDPTQNIHRGSFIKLNNMAKKQRNYEKKNVGEFLEIKLALY